MSTTIGILISSAFASLNLGWGIYNVLQPEITPIAVALNFSAALFITLMTYWNIATSTNR